MTYLAYSQRSGSRPDTVRGRNTTRVGAFYYVDTFLGKRVSAASYSLQSLRLSTVAAVHSTGASSRTGGLADANPRGLELEAGDQGVCHCRRHGLEQLELPGRRDLLHAANNVAVVDRRLEAIGRRGVPEPQSQRS